MSDGYIIMDEFGLVYVYVYVYSYSYGQCCIGKKCVTGGMEGGWWCSFAVGWRRDERGGMVVSKGTVMVMVLVRGMGAYVRCVMGLRSFLKPRLVRLFRGRYV